MNASLLATNRADSGRAPKCSVRKDATNGCPQEGFHGHHSGNLAVDVMCRSEPVQR